MKGILMKSKVFVDEEIEILRREIEGMEDVPVTLIIRVGENQDSVKYIRNKVHLSERIGAKTIVKVFDENIKEKCLIEYIDGYINNNPEIDGCLIQLPLPKHINENKVLEALSHEKDVDGFAKENLGKLLRGEDTVVACTPRGIIDLIKYYGIEMKGKDVVIVNRSTIVGKPLALLFLQEDSTVQICHSKTKNLFEKVKNADIVVTAIGTPDTFRSYNFKPNATIIDVSMNVGEDGKLCGDVCKMSYDNLLEKGCNITPVPGGVGGTTVLSLLKNTLEIKKRKR